MSISVIIPVYNVKPLLARCLYRTETIRDIRFPDGISIYEDLPWWGEVLLHVGKATILNLPQEAEEKRAPPESANPLAEAEFLLFLQPHGKDFQIFRSRE